MRVQIPVRVTKRNKSQLFRKSKLVRIYFLLQLSELMLKKTAENDQMVALCGSFILLRSETSPRDDIWGFCLAFIIPYPIYDIFLRKYSCFVR